MELDIPSLKQTHQSDCRILLNLLLGKMQKMLNTTTTTKEAVRLAEGISLCLIYPL